MSGNLRHLHTIYNKDHEKWNQSVISSVAQSCLILCEPMECSSPDPSIFHNLESRFKFMSIELIMLSNHFILCCPLSSSGQFSSVTQLCPTLCNPMDCSMPGFPVHHQLLDPTQTHVHRVGDDIQPSHPLSSPFPPALNLYQHQGLFKWVTSLHQVAKVLEFQLQHQSFQWIFRTDFL